MTRKFLMMILTAFLTVIGCFVLGSAMGQTSSAVKKLSYLKWEPVLKADNVYAKSIAFTYLRTEEGNLFWIELRPDEGGRCVLVQRNQAGVVRDLTPKPFSVRTRVYEYGGSAYVVKGSWIYFVNFTDQRIYRLNLQHPADITAITPELNADGSLGKYMDLTVSPDGKWLAFVYEKEVKKGENPNYVAMLDLSNNEIQEPKILVQGANFYKSPSFSLDGTHLAWLEWNHPYMPWDSTKLYLARFKAGKLIGNTKRIAGDDDSSISSIAFQSDGSLYYAQDFAGKHENDPLNYYNIYRYQNGKITTVTQKLGDFQSIMLAGANLLTIFEQRGEPSLLLLNLKTGKTSQIGSQYSEIRFPAWGPSGNVYLVGYSVNQPNQLIDISSNGQVNVLKESTDYRVDPKAISRPQLIEVPTSDGKKTYGYFYPAVNPHYQALPNEKPPVRVLVHGGPVYRTSKFFALSTLYWTSQGIAVFDINYRGSTGFGRAYRDALKKNWGILEVQDIKDSLAELRRRGLISDKAVVSGGSAGGYTVDRVLSYYPDLFVAGASSFGIANLPTFQKSTHKFESHYLEQLIGGTVETNLAEYKDRSLIYHLDKLKAPMIIFQGADDKVVPPENSREIAEVLKNKGIYYEYYEYPGEAHGFRKKENLVDALEKEARFFKKTLTQNI